MARAYSNFWSSAAARLTIIAHGQAAAIRWGVLIFLVLVWFGLGMYFFLLKDHNNPFEAIYRTFGAVSMSDDYFEASAHSNVSADERNAVRFAALLVPVVGLLFAFSGALGRHLAQTFNLGAHRHVVIAGDSNAALSLALDCRLKKDAVILIGQGLSADTALALRRDGVIVIEGDATRPEVLHSARAQHAAHVVAFEPDDTTNLQIEACVRRLLGGARRKPPIGVHVATRSPLLLREAREMRSAQMRKHEKTRKKPDETPPIDPKPFSLDEMAARALIQQEAAIMLDVASKLKTDRVHVVFFGFDEAAEALSERLLASLWSARFEPPRLTVLTPDAQATEGRFRARHREIFAHPALWSADMHFEEFDWNAASMGPEVLTDVEAKYGKITAAVVSTGADPRNIHLSIGLKRVCDNRDRWPIPIFMKESAQSEFSKEYARGDDTPEFDAFLLAFGSHQQTSTRALILDGELDAGAAIAHEHYRRGVGAEAMNMRELAAASREWGDVMETYRAANRAVSDSAPVKLWDIGLRPARKGEKGDTAPVVPADMSEKLARREHDRWVAERLLSGWRPTEQGEARDNEIMAHDKLVPWDALNDKDKTNDVVQVRAAINIARTMNKDGFVARS